MTALRWGATALVIVTTVVVQVAVLDTVRPLGIRVDLPLLLVLGTGFSSRRSDAAVVGWCTGLLVDLHQLGPLGLSALVYAVAGWSLADSRARVVEGSPLFRTVQGALAALTVSWLLWVATALVGQLGEPAHWSLLGWSAGLALSGAIGVHPATAVGHWLQRDRQLTSRMAQQRTRPA